jgi:hypothetical protein
MALKMDEICKIILIARQFWTFLSLIWHLTDKKLFEDFFYTELNCDLTSLVKIVKKWTTKHSLFRVTKNHYMYQHWRHSRGNFNFSFFFFTVAFHLVYGAWYRSGDSSAHCTFAFRWFMSCLSLLFLFVHRLGNGQCTYVGHVALWRLWMLPQCAIGHADKTQFKRWQIYYSTYKLDITEN